MGLKGFENVIRTNINSYEEDYNVVEHKLQVNKEPTLYEVRRWFIYHVEKEYNTKLLGTQINYCYNTFNKLKEKYSLKNNIELCKKLTNWNKQYKQEFSGVFDFSKLNTDWVLEKLETKATYHVENDYIPNTVNRRI